MERETKRRSVRAALFLLGLAAIFALVVLVIRPPCLIREITGFYCPGCGGQRMVWAILQGDFSGAFRQNPFLFCLVPLAAGYLLWETARYAQKKRPLYKSGRFAAALTAVVVLSVIFAVLRNLPGFGFLGPAA